MDGKGYYHHLRFGEFGHLLTCFVFIPSAVVSSKVLHRFFIHRVCNFLMVCFLYSIEYLETRWFYIEASTTLFGAVRPQFLARFYFSGRECLWSLCKQTPGK
jgi:hypothetical protein